MDKTKKRVALKQLSGRTIELVSQSDEEDLWEVHVDGRAVPLYVCETQTVTGNRGTSTKGQETRNGVTSTPLYGFAKKVKLTEDWERRDDQWRVSAIWARSLGAVYNTGVYETISVELALRSDCSEANIDIKTNTDIST